MPIRLLATADSVPDFGRIGIYGFRVAGIDDRGRALLERDSHLAAGLYWADGEGLVPAIDAGAAEPVRALLPENPSPGGNFVVLGSREAGVAYWRTDGLFAIEQGRPRRVVGIGDVDTDGNTLCAIRRPHINDAGVVAFEADIAIAGHRCWETDEGDEYIDLMERAVYVAGNDAHLVARTGSFSLPLAERRLVELLRVTDDGRAVVALSALRSAGSGAASLEVVAADHSGTSRLVAFDGARFAEVTILGTNRDGDVVFAAVERGKRAIYRTSGGDVLRVVGEGDGAPQGDPYYRYDFEGVSWAHLNRRGDVLLPLRYANILYPAGGEPRVIPGIGGWINDAGDIVAIERVAPNGVLEVVLWRGDQARRLVGTGDLLPNGEFLLSNGLKDRCLGDDGSAAVVAEADSGEGGLLCVDTAGAHVIARIGDPTPAGRRFYGFSQCEIAQTGEVVFAASRLIPYPEHTPLDAYTWYGVENAIYRARVDRLERVIGPGDITDDGEVVQGLGISPFDADAAGRVLTFANLEGAGSSIVVRDNDGSLRALRIPTRISVGGLGLGFAEASEEDHLYLSGESEVPTVTRRRPYGSPTTTDAGGAAALTAKPSAEEERRFGVVAARLADSGDVIMLAVERVHRSWGSEENGPVILLRWSERGVETLFHGEEWVWDPGFDLGLSSLRVAGDRIAFEDGAHDWGIFIYDLREGRPTEVARSGDPSPAGQLQRPRLAALTAAGDVYLTTWSENRDALLSWEHGALRLVGENDSGSPIEVGFDGTLLLRGSDALRVQGNGPSAASCPLPPTVVLPTATPSFIPSATATPTATTTRPTSDMATASPSHTPATPAVPMCGPGVACIRVGSVSGAAGARARFEVRVHTAALPITAVQNDIHLSGGGGLIRCAANRAIVKEATRFAVTEENVRAIVLSLENQTVIADGALLYTCEVELADDASPGRFALQCTNPHASDGLGNDQPVACVDGGLVVIAAAPVAPSTSTPLSSCDAGTESRSDGVTRESPISAGGCTATPGSRSSDSWMLLLAAVAFISLRRLSRRPG